MYPPLTPPLGRGRRRSRATFGVKYVREVGRVRGHACACVCVSVCLCMV